MKDARFQSKRVDASDRCPSLKRDLGRNLKFESPLRLHSSAQDLVRLQLVAIPAQYTRLAVIGNHTVGKRDSDTLYDDVKEYSVIPYRLQSRYGVATVCSYHPSSNVLQTTILTFRDKGHLKADGAACGIITLSSTLHYLRRGRAP